MRNIMAKCGDKVLIPDIGKGKILRIRFDDDNEEIYTVLLDDLGITDDNLFYARHCELKFL